MNKKLLIIVTSFVVIVITSLLIYFVLLPNIDPVRKETKKLSDNLFEIPGGSYYGDGFIISQTKDKNGQTTFGILINTEPFAEYSLKALSWLESQGTNLESINYNCEPTQYSKATAAEIAKCTHSVN